MVHVIPFQTMTKVTEANKAYIAGMIDADGHVSIVPNKQSKTTAVRVAITNTYIPLLQQLVEWTGGSINHRRKPCDLDCVINHVHSRKQSYRFIVVGDRAVVILQNIVPYMIEKQDLAFKAIDEGLKSRELSRVKRESNGVKELRSLGWRIN